MPDAASVLGGVFGWHVAPVAGLMALQEVVAPEYLESVNNGEPTICRDFVKDAERADRIKKKLASLG